MKMFIKKVRRNIRDYGLYRTLSKIVGSITRPIFQRRTYQLYRADLSKETVPAVTDAGLQFRFLDPGDADFVRQIEGMEEWLEGQVDPMLRAGAQCLLALDQRTLAGFNLVSFDRIHLPVVHYERPLRKRQGFSVQITVSKAYRGRGLATTLRLEVYRALRARGIRYFYGGTDVHNTANLALCRKVGLHGLAAVRYWKFLWIERTTVRRWRE